MSPTELARLAKQRAAQLGFDACGITHPGPSDYADAYDRWLAAGHHGEMRYLVRHAAGKKHPSVTVPDASSIVVVLHNYYVEQTTEGAGYRVARYAQGVDYHIVMARLLRDIGEVLVAAAGRGSYRVLVDASQLPERELASRAGLGWQAKNTMLIHPKLGSYTFIGCVVTDLDLARDEPFVADRCGTCTRCLDACPTGAFPEPHVLDARRCISYLTIEARSEPPSPLRPLIGDHLFGCDVCQEVCPWNGSFASETHEEAYRARAAEDWPTLDEILAMDEAGFDRIFGETAIERARVAGLQRNARVVKENRA